MADILDFLTLQDKQNIHSVRFLPVSKARTNTLYIF
jgi:hypothetical protein